MAGATGPAGKVRKLIDQLLNAVAEWFAPGLAPGAEGLFAGIAVPLGTIGANTAPAQHVSFLSQLQRLVARQTPVRDLLHMVVAIAPGTDGGSARFHILNHCTVWLRRSSFIVRLACDSARHTHGNKKTPRRHGDR